MSSHSYISPYFQNQSIFGQGDYLEMPDSPIKNLLVFAAWSLKDTLARSHWSLEDIVGIINSFNKDDIFLEINSGFHLGNEGIYLNKAALYPKRFFHFLMRAVVNTQDAPEKEILAQLLLDTAQKFSGMGFLNTPSEHHHFTLTPYALSMGYLEASHPDFELIKKVCQAEWDNNLAFEKIIDFPLNLICSYETDSQYKKYKSLLLSMFLQASEKTDDFLCVLNKYEYFKSMVKKEYGAYKTAPVSSLLVCLSSHPTLGQEILDFIVERKGLDYLAASYEEIKPLPAYKDSEFSPFIPQIEKLLLEHSVSAKVCDKDNSSSNLPNSAFKI